MHNTVLSHNERSAFLNHLVLWNALAQQLHRASLFRHLKYVKPAEADHIYGA